MEKVNTNGPKDVHIKDNGKIICFMDKVSILGLMAESIMALISMIKNMDLVSINGQMARNIMVDGLMANNMVKLCLLVLKVRVD